MSQKVPAHTPGLAFRKMDLHLHTPASKCFQDKSVTAEMIVAEALGKKLEGIAVTDHNSGAWIDNVKTAAAGRGLVVFPGVEITCMGGKEGIHMIALFDPKCGKAEIESLLGNLELTPSEYGDISALVKKDPISVARIVHRRGGLVVLAHANSTRGALNDMSGQQRTDLIRCLWVDAAEGTDFQNSELATKRKRVVELLDGSDATYQRKLAVYQASDNPSGAGDGRHSLKGIGTRSAFFKLDQMNIEGLRQCFADPEVRIRQDFEYSTSTYPRIKSVRITGGFLDGAEAHFHAGLNSILGAKGAGKSLLVEFLRFVLDQPPSNEDIRQDHLSKLQARLEDYGTVEVVLADETGKGFPVKRTFSPADDNPYEGAQRYDVGQLFPVLFLSQNEIIKVAESEDEQIAFIDRFFDFRAYRAEIAQLERQLEVQDAELADALRASQEAKELEKTIATAQAEVLKLDAALKNPVFDEYTKLEAKDRAFREQLAYLKGCMDRLKESRKDSLAPTPPALPEPLKEDPALRRTLDTSNRAKSLLSQRFEELTDELSVLAQKAQEEHRTWLPTFQDGKKYYEQAVQQEGGDYKILAQKRARRVKDLEGLTQRLAAAKAKSSRTKEIAGSRDAVLDKMGAAYEGYSRERKARCQTIETESAGRLKVRIHESSNVDEFRNQLTALKRGSYLRESEIDKICSGIDSRTFIRKIINFSVSRNVAHLEDVARKVGIEVDRMRTLGEFLLNEIELEELLSLEYKAIPQDRPEIKYKVGNNNYELLEKLSVGQKCTAMLIIALSEGTMPIVIDQPEDSLDLRSIWEDICLKIRRGKERRQFVFTTHNSSVAVASDTDKFIIVEGGSSQGKVVFSGSMDHAPVSEEALKYLEGGVATYRTKYNKYRGEDILGK